MSGHAYALAGLALALALVLLRVGPRAILVLAVQGALVSLVFAINGRWGLAIVELISGCLAGPFALARWSPRIADPVPFELCVAGVVLSALAVLGGGELGIGLAVSVCGAIRTLGSRRASGQLAGLIAAQNGLALLVALAPTAGSWAAVAVLPIFPGLALGGLWLIARRPRAPIDLGPVRFAPGAFAVAAGIICAVMRGETVGGFAATPLAAFTAFAVGIVLLTERRRKPQQVGGMQVLISDVAVAAGSILAAGVRSDLGITAAVTAALGGAVYGHRGSARQVRHCLFYALTGAALLSAGWLTAPQLPALGLAALLASAGIVAVLCTPAAALAVTLVLLASRYVPGLDLEVLAAALIAALLAGVSLLRSKAAVESAAAGQAALGIAAIAAGWPTIGVAQIAITLLSWCAVPLALPESGARLFALAALSGVLPAGVFPTLAAMLGLAAADRLVLLPAFALPAGLLGWGTLRLLTPVRAPTLSAEAWLPLGAAVLLGFAAPAPLSLWLAQVAGAGR